MAEYVKIGFIGCGGNARGHMGSLSKMEDVKLVALCDLNAERASSAAEQFGAKAYTDHKVMLSEEDLDAMYISIPVFAHGTPELDTIQSGLPFLVEKPVAINMETAEKVLEAVEKNNIITCAGYQLRYTGAADAARDILQGKTVNIVSGKYWCDTGIGSPDAWLRRMDQSGGQIVEQATHTIDMMRYLIGEVKEVFALQENRVLKEIDCPDSNVVCMKFENGAIGTITTEWAYSGGWSNANVLDILFDNSLLHWTTGGIEVTPEPDAPTEVKQGRSIDRVFVDAVKSGDGSEILSPYSDAVKSLAISLAANRSGKSGKLESV
ncbi:Gfo/Idh/MocA family protein [Candidatus Poribacteria bacterium]